MNKQSFKIDWKSTMTKMQEQNQKKSFNDNRVYYPQLKDNGTAEAVIRFLPSLDTDIPYVKTHTHSFKGPGGWFINDCPTTIAGNQCPVCKENSEIWNSNDEKTARQLVGMKGRKTYYYSNILVVKDPQNKDNEGKVFLFKYGAKIFEKIMQKMAPPKDSVDNPIMIFDWYEGANFKLKIKKVKTGEKEYPNYDNSEWDVISPIAATDEAIAKIADARFGIKEFIDPSKFKSYAELEDRYMKVIGNASSPSVGSNLNSNKTKTEAKQEPSNPQGTEAPTEGKQPQESSESPEADEVNDDDFFNSLKKDSKED